MPKRKKIRRRGDSELPTEFKSLLEAQCDANLIGEFIAQQCNHYWDEFERAEREKENE